MINLRSTYLKIESVESLRKSITSDSYLSYDDMPQGMKDIWKRIISKNERLAKYDDVKAEIIIPSEDPNDRCIIDLCGDSALFICGTNDIVEMSAVASESDSLMSTMKKIGSKFGKGLTSKSMEECVHKSSTIEFRSSGSYYAPIMPYNTIGWMYEIRKGTNKKATCTNGRCRNVSVQPSKRICIAFKGTEMEAMKAAAKNKAEAILDEFDDSDESTGINEIGEDSLEVKIERGKSNLKRVIYMAEEEVKREGGPVKPKNKNRKKKKGKKK